MTGRSKERDQQVPLLPRRDERGQATAGRAPADHDGTVRVLAVCTGNICRSPIMERLLGVHLQDVDRGVAVSSAGLRAMPGRAMEPGAARFLREHGVAESAPFAARRLAPDLVAEADLVLTVERAQRSLVAGFARGSWDRTFTVREFARLIEDAPVTGLPPGDRLLALVAHATARRRHGGVGQDQDDDVADPIGRRYPVFRRSGDRILSAVETIARQVRVG